MSVEQISQDITTALKAGDKPKAEALRLLKSSLINARIAVGHELNEEEVAKVIRKEIKSRIEARDIFQTNDRQEQADKEEFERKTYAVYLPEELNEEEVKNLVKASLEELGAGVQFGQVIGLAIKKADGRADGARLSQEIKKQQGV